MQRLEVTPGQAARLIWPFALERIVGQLRMVLPVVAYLFLFQLLILRLPVEDAASICLGLACVIMGLAVFMEGLRLGIMPFSETIGAALPTKSPLLGIIAFAFFLGIGATLAEPAIGALKSAGANIDPAEAPLLYAMLTRYSTLLVAAVGLGVGIATTIGILRFLYKWPLKWLIVPTVMLLIGTSIWAEYSGLGTVVGLAWDSGAVTTGPVTVPLVLALGIGVCRVAGHADTGLSGFGIVTLASLCPIIAVFALAIVLHNTVPASELQAGLSDLRPEPASSFWDSNLVKAARVAAQAILPLVLALLVVQKVLLREPLQASDEILLGVALAVGGMALFNLGLSIGLTPLGDQVGSTVPSAFSEIAAGAAEKPHGPLYGDTWGKVVALVFGGFLGYGATLAEPALNALGTKVEDVTVGAFKRKVLIQAVAIGVAVGVTLGLAKIIFELPLIYLLIPLYALALILSVLSSEEFVNIGWDSAGVTTGPVTVPLVIALGLGIGNASPAVVEGFGILAMASVGPILSVLMVGLAVRLFQSREAKRIEATNGIG